MPQIQRIHTNARMSGAVIHGGVVYLAGQVPNDLSLPVQAQTQQVLDKIDALLAEAGSHKGQLLSAQIWLKDIEEDFALMNAIWAAWLPAGSAPARATVQAKLANAQVRVEIMVVAAAG